MVIIRGQNENPAAAVVFQGIKAECINCEECVVTGLLSGADGAFICNAMVTDYV